MYLSRVVIQNFRSIENIDLTFTKGKNIIVGKNNCGKSNIVKAIDLVLGENLPAYAKSENITENDFFGRDTSKMMLIYCELRRDINEELNYDSMYKCYGFYRYNSQSFPDFDFSNNYTVNNIFFEIDQDKSLKKWINPKEKKLHGGTPLEDQFKDKYLFSFILIAYEEDDKIHKDIRFFYKAQESDAWIMAFSAPFRNELLQSAMIPSFRDPSNQLRINNYSWFGKLLKNYVDLDNEQLKEAFEVSVTASKAVFEEMNQKVFDPNFDIAFPNTEVRFQFNPNHEDRTNLYKSTLIYVNDYFDSLLHEKGSGIQSAVIIGLFKYYIKNIAHPSGSLLIVEEPELFLHPQGRRVIANRLDGFCADGTNQVIITTHANEFITVASESLNIIHVKKSEGKTQAQNATFDKPKLKQILLKKQNSEMFFADVVILVEGAEKYILEEIAKSFGKKQGISENWLDDHNISIITVGGKRDFWKYVSILSRLNITHYVVADFDFLISGLSEYYTELKFDTRYTDPLNAVKSKISNRLKSSEIKLNKVKKLSDFEESVHDSIISFLHGLLNNKIAILSGELEHFYTDECRTKLKGFSGTKEEPVVYIVSELVNDANPIGNFINTQEYEKVLEAIALELGLIETYTSEETPQPFDDDDLPF